MNCEVHAVILQKRENTGREREEKRREEKKSEESQRERGVKSGERVNISDEEGKRGKEEKQ